MVLSEKTLMMQFQNKLTQNEQLCTIYQQQLEETTQHWVSHSLRSTRILQLEMLRDLV